MPLGSERDLGLAGPYGTPLIAELPAPADPAGGVSCAKARPWKLRLPSMARTSAEVRNMGCPSWYESPEFAAQQNTAI
jgi:hypothetical protein